MKNKIGLVVTTYNTEKWFKDLYDTIPFDRLGKVIIVNGGNQYKGQYSHANNWIQHATNRGAAQSRIDGIKFLQEQGIEHIFVIEDDMLIKRNDIFEQYINASLETGIKYFCFCSNAQGTGIPNQRTPSEVVEYTNTKIAFYREMNNEFTYHHASIFEQIGYYDPNFKHLWDVEFVYRVLTSDKFGCGFRYFPDLINSDELIKNHLESINNSRTNSNNKRDHELSDYLNLFHDKHRYRVQQIPILEKKEFINKLRQLYKNK
jgi:hypothetical protein